MALVPNIYASRHYKMLIVIPFLFLVASAFFIPKIPAGIDLRGGILITTQTNSTVDADALTAALKQGLGVTEVSVKTGPAPGGGTGLEVEIEQNDKLAAAEIALRRFYESYEEFTAQDYAVVSYASGLNSSNLTESERATMQAGLADAQAKRTAALDSIMADAQAIQSNTEPFIGPVAVSRDMDSTTIRNALASAYADAKTVYRDRVLSAMRSQVAFTDFTYKDVSPSLSEFFLQKTTQVVIVSFILTALVVALVIRSPVPSFAVIFGALNDIVFALGAMGLFGIPMTLASVGALLMLIGFSLDTDMLLTIRIMKRTEGFARDRAYGAMKTGLMMSATAIAAFTILFLLSIVTQLPTYRQIAAVAICGLIGDVIATWCTNAVIVLWSVEGKQHHEAGTG